MVKTYLSNNFLLKDMYVIFSLFYSCDHLKKRYTCFYIQTTFHAIWLIFVKNIMDTVHFSEAFHVTVSCLSDS